MSSSRASISPDLSPGRTGLTHEPVAPQDTEMPLPTRNKRPRALGGSREGSPSVSDRSRLDHGESPQSTAILTNLRNKIVESLSYSPFSQQDRAAYQRARLNVQQAKTEYLAHHNPGKSSEELERLPQPEVFSQIAGQAREEAGRRQREKKVDLVIKNRPNMRRADLLEKSDEEIDRVAAPCLEEVALVKSVNDRLGRLMDSSGLSQPPHNYRLQAERRNSREFLVNTDGNIAVSYGVFDEFRAVGKQHGLESYGGIELSGQQPKYNMENKFVSNVNEMKKLNADLKITEQAIGEVGQILTELLKTSKNEDAEDMRKYIGIGQKPAFELVKSGVGLGHQAREYFEYVAEPTDPVPLLTTVSIDLENHPQRDQVRAQIEQVYRDCGLKDTHGRDKTFIKGDPYRSNLSPAQLREIAPSLSALVKAKRLQDSKNDTSLIGNIRGHFRSYDSSPLNLLKNHDANDLLKIAKRIDINCAKNSNLESQRLPSMKEASTSFPALNKEFTNTLDQILRFFSVANLEPQSQLPELTRQHKESLYQSKLPLAIDNNERTRSEVIETQVGELFITLKKSKAYLDAEIEAPALQEVLNALQHDFKSRLSGGSGIQPYKNLEPKGFYGQDMVRRAVASLEAYVGKIHFAQELKISSESIERSLSMLAGQVGSEMTTHCATGFAGRIEEPLTALVSDADDLVSQGVRNFKMQCVNEAFQKVYGGSSESSMSTQAKSRLMKELGLLSADQGAQAELTPSYLSSYSNVGRLRDEFSKKYQPNDIYKNLLKHVTDAFAQAASSGDDTEVHKILSTLKFDAGEGDIYHQFREFRVNQDPSAPWQPAFFQHDVPAKLVSTMMEKSIILQKDEGYRQSADHRHVQQERAQAVPTQYSAAGRTESQEV